MLSRIRFTLGLALPPILAASLTAFVKVFFIFIVVSGSNLKEAVRVADPALTAEFHAFADFSQGEVEAPADPGTGYEITRYRWDGQREVAFDRLHYYPESGFVYYEGLVNGSSEYDGKWYVARPEIKSAFETALYAELRLIALGTEKGSRAMVPPPQNNQTDNPNPVGATARSQSALLIALAAGLAAVIVVAFLRVRRLSHFG